jgi:hypothetical protein
MLAVLDLHGLRPSEEVERAEILGDEPRDRAIGGDFDEAYRLASVRN